MGNTRPTLDDLDSVPVLPLQCYHLRFRYLLLVGILCQGRLHVHVLHARLLEMRLGLRWVYRMVLEILEWRTWDRRLLQFIIRGVRRKRHYLPTLLDFLVFLDFLTLTSYHLFDCHTTLYQILQMHFMILVPEVLGENWEDVDYFEQGAVR